jgi:hypothetical protein
MRRTLVTLSLAAISLVGWTTSYAFAQEKTARGSVTAMTGDTVTVKAGAQELRLTVDAKTTVTASGAGTANRAAEAAGKAGAKLGDIIKVGDNVEVTYHEMGGTMHAASIRKVAALGSGGGGTVEKPMMASGTVDSVTASSLVVSAAGGTKMTFTIDGQSKVVGRGVGTAAAAKGGKTSITDLVASGDRVSVSYHKTGDTMHAAEVRITAKAK